MSSFLENLTWKWLLPLAVLTALAPWPAGPEPHLVEKTRMLLAGELTRPLDIFDLVFHGSASVLVVAKAMHTWVSGRR